VSVEEVDPAPLHSSFLAAMAEFAALGPGDSASDQWIAQWAGEWEQPGRFGAFLAALVADAREETPRPAHHVPCTTWFWVDGQCGQEYLGRLSLRHRLNENLLSYGGHVGYDVRPSARCRGHAAAMLGAALPRVAARGIERVLLTVDPGNVASIRVIERHGGVLEDVRETVRGTKRRYWIDLRARGPLPPP